MHAFLREAVHHARGHESRCVGTFRAVAGRLPLFRYGGEGRNPDREIFRRQDLPFAKLFRGFGEAGNGKDSAGVHTVENDSRSQRTDARPGGNHQADCRIIGFPTPTAFRPVFQTTRGLYSEGIQEQDGGFLKA